MSRTVAAACILLLFGTSSAQAGVKDDVNRALGQFNRDFCRTFNMKSCKTAPASPQRMRTPTKPEAKPKVEQATKPGKGQPAASRVTPQEVVPVPRQKPQLPEPAVTASTTPAEEPVIPVPRAKPIAPVKEASPAPGKPLAAVEGAKLAAVTPILPAPRSVTAPEPPVDADCQNRLSRLGLSFTPKPTFATSGSCTLTDPVLLSSLSLDDGKVIFPDQPVLNCAFAESFAKWVKEEGNPAAQREAKSGLSVLYTGPGYDCRGRNGDGSAKLSEHGYGNAVDITLFKLKDGRTFLVSDALNPVSPAYATLKSMRFTACERFSTVLGPGTNAAHAEHFHFDNGRHGKTGTYRICE